jgi:hypothetical protein
MEQQLIELHTETCNFLLRRGFRPKDVWQDTTRRPCFCSRSTPTKWQNSSGTAESNTWVHSENYFTEWCRKWLEKKLANLGVKSTRPGNYHPKKEMLIHLGPKEDWQVLRLCRWGKPFRCDSNTNTKGRGVLQHHPVTTPRKLFKTGWLKNKPVCSWHLAPSKNTSWERLK